MNRTHLFELIFEVLQLPIIGIVVIFVNRARIVTRYSELILLMIAFVFNMLYIALNILNSDIFKLVFDTKSINYLSEIIETVDLLTFVIFDAAFLLFLNSIRKGKIGRGKRKSSFFLVRRNYMAIYIVVIILGGITLTSILSGLDASFYLKSSSIFKIFSILLVALFFNEMEFKDDKNRNISFLGLSFWGFLQLTNFLPQHVISENVFWFYFISLIGKVLIAIGIFSDSLLFKLQEVLKEREKVFEGLLEETFHEVTIPLNAMGDNLQSLAPSDRSKGQKYLELESDFEKIQGIIMNSKDDFSHIRRSDSEYYFESFLSSSEEKSEVININRIIQKCVKDVKKEFPENTLNFNIKFGKKVQALGNQHEVYQIIVNLIKNSIEAYLDTERSMDLVIVTGHKTEDRHSSENGIFPFFEIKDFAGGIPKSIQDKIWDKGFSTKLFTGGAIRGQGLSIVNRLSEKNNIEIILHSATNEEKGIAPKYVGVTIFTLFFKNKIF